MPTPKPPQTPPAWLQNVQQFESNSLERNCTEDSRDPVHVGAALGLIAVAMGSPAIEPQQPDGEGSSEIREVHAYMRDADGEVLVHCPHCHWLIGLEPGPFKGEQFQHKANKKCNGWFEVARTAKRQPLDN